MFVIDSKKIKDWMTDEAFLEFMDYLQDKTLPKDKNIYYFNFENWMLRKKYIKTTKLD